MSKKLYQNIATEPKSIDLKLITRIEQGKYVFRTLLNIGDSCFLIISSKTADS